MNLMKKLRETRKNKKGFTLVELIVVLVIIAILAAIAIPTFFSYIQKAKDQSLAAEQRTAVIAVQSAASEALDPKNATWTVAEIAAEASELAGFTITEVTLVVDGNGAIQTIKATFPSKQGTAMLGTLAGNTYTWADAT